MTPAVTDIFFVIAVVLCAIDAWQHKSLLAAAVGFMALAFIFIS